MWKLGLLKNSYTNTWLIPRLEQKIVKYVDGPI